MDPDRLLAPYLREAGLEPKAEPYGNWESTGLDGHYVSALALMVASTGDPEIRERLEYMVSEMKRAQDASGNGYLGGVPGGEAMWQEVAQGAIEANLFALNDKWVPWYNLHKVYAGLRDAYVHGGIEDARGMLVDLTDWERVVRTPTFHMFEMYKVHQDAESVPLVLDRGTYTHGGETVPAVSASASRDAEGRVHVSMTNLDPNQSRTVTASVRGGTLSSVSGRILTADAMNAHNTFDAPNEVAPTAFNGARLDGEILTITLPPNSVVALELE